VKDKKRREERRRDISIHLPNSYSHNLL